MLNNNRIISSIYLFLFMCVTYSLKAETYKLSRLIAYDSIMPFKIKRDINSKSTVNELKIIIRNQLNSSYGDSIKLKDIESVKYYKSLALKGLSEGQIFKIKFNRDLPSSRHHYAVLIIDNTRNNAYLLDLDAIEPIKSKKDDNDYYFAGRYKDRFSLGTFKIYKFINNVMYQIFESDKAVSNYSYDCISYQNDNLKLLNIDFNEDGYLDINFTGLKNFYCNGYEQSGRSERKPIKKEWISITYYFDSSNMNWVNKNTKY